MESRTRKSKKRNSGGYFSSFGLRQASDILMLLAALVVFIGLFLVDKTTGVIAVGIIMFILGSLLAIYRCIRILRSGINRRSPEYKAALVNLIIMAVLVIAAVIGLIFCF